MVRPTNAGNFDDLLTRLAKIKSVPATPAARASGVAPRQDNREPSSGSGFISQSQTTQLGLRDAVLNSFRNSSALDYN